MQNMKIIYKNVDALIPYANNPRTHSPAQIAQIASSIKEFGWTNPVLLDGDNGVIAGHGRLEASRILGIESVPTIELKHLTEAQKKAYIIADNQLAQNAGWDDDLLGIEIGALQDIGFDIALLGFDDKDIARLTFSSGDGLTDPDEVPDVEESICKTGDTWLLGEHRLLCGDATKKEDVDMLMDGNKADMVFTDPPYGINLNTDYSTMDNGVAGKKHKNIIGDSDDYDPTFMLSFFSYCNEIILFGADYYSEKIINKNDGSWLVWDKRVEEKYDAVIGSAFELMWSKKKRKREIIRHNYSSWANRMEGAVNNHKPHPSMKPIAVLVAVLEKTKSKSIVDIYLGSGSTLIACEKTNRKCYGMEIDPHYCDVIINRWQNFTGKKAIKGGVMVGV